MGETKEEILNAFIKQIMKNSRHCNHCMNCHYPNSYRTFCFFAYAYLRHDFDYFNEGDDD